MPLLLKNSALEQARHAANPCKQYNDTLGFCLHLKIKGEAFKWIQEWMVNNGMFVGDEQYKQCALVVLGKGDLVDAKKDLWCWQVLFCINKVTLAKNNQGALLNVSAWTQGQFQLLCTRFVGSALNMWCDLQAQNGAKGFRQEAAKRCKAEALSQWTGTNKLYGSSLVVPLTLTAN